MWFKTKAEACRYLRCHPFRELMHVVKCNRLTLSGPVPGWTAVLKEA